MTHYQISITQSAFDCIKQTLTTKGYKLEEVFQDLITKSYMQSLSLDFNCPFHELDIVKMIKNPTQTLYEAWNDGKIGGFGSFHTSMLQSYRLADEGNRNRLDFAFPEYFVDQSNY